VADAATISTAKVWRYFYFGLPGLLGLALGLALAGRISFLAATTNQWLPYPFFRTGSSEGLMLSEIAMLRQGQPIYVPLGPAQFISAPYPPLYYYLVAWLWPQSASAAQGFEIGRIVSLVATFVTAVCVGLTAIFDTRRKVGTIRKACQPKLPVIARFWRGLPYVMVGLVGAALYLSFPAVAVWATRVRADMTMTALQMLGLALVAWKPRGWQMWAAILPFVLAIYTKQTALAGPAAALIFLALQNWPNYKRISLWLGGLVVANLVPLLLINLATGGEFWLRLFKYHNLGWLVTNFNRYLGLFWQENTALLIAGVALLGWVAWVIGKGKVRAEGWLPTLQQVPLSLLYLLFSLPILLGLGVAGADHNHFLPAEAATGCVGATLLGWAMLHAQRNLNWWLTTAVIILLLQQAAVFSVPDPRYEIEFRQYKPDEQAQLAQLIKLVASNPSPLLTTEAGFFPLTGKTPNYDDLFTLTALVNQNIYDQTGLLERVRHKEFSLILAPPGDLFNNGVRSDLWTPALLAALQANYQLKYHDVWFVYVPNP